MADSDHVDLDDDPDAMDSSSCLLHEHLKANIPSNWEYFELALDFTTFLDDMLTADPDDPKVSALVSSLGEVDSNGSTEILNYISNDFFPHFFSIHKDRVNEITHAFNVQLKISKKRQISIVPVDPKQKIAIVTNDGKKRLVDLDNHPTTSSILTSAENLTTTTSETPPASDSDPKLNETPQVTQNHKTYHIFCETIKNYKEMLQFFKQECPDVNAKLTGTFIKLTIHSTDEYRKIQALLEKHKIPFRTMDPRSERPRKVLLRGLPSSTPTTDIQQALLEHGLEPITIAQLRSRKAVNKGTPLPLFVITLRATPNFEEIYNLEHINFLKVTIERFKGQQYRQCYRCQRYGHSSFSCRLPIRCLKCAQAHKASDCKITKDTDLKCALCDGNHPANYSGCPRHPSNKTPSPHSVTKNNPKTPPTNRATAKPTPSRTFPIATSNAWAPLADTVDEQEVVENPSQPSSSSENTTKNSKRKPQNNKQPPHKIQKTNELPPRAPKNPKPNNTQTMHELFAVFQQIKEFTTTFNVSDILQLLKNALSIFTDTSLTLIDKIAAIFSMVDEYCNPQDNHE